MQLDHIEQRSESHDDTIENAIPVCFECHAEIHLYNPDHPLGRRYTPAELRLHREQWLHICREFPGVVAGAATVSEAGTVERLLHEIDYNLEVASHSTENNLLGCPFETVQFDRAVADGAYAMFNDEFRQKLRTAYMLAKRANTFIAAIPFFAKGSDPWAGAMNNAQNSAAQAKLPFEGLKKWLFDNHVLFMR